MFQLFRPVTISHAVYQEVIEGGVAGGYADAILLRNYVENGLIVVQNTGSEESLLQGYLHPGERESIQLANELGDLLVVDDEKARIIAEKKNLPFCTTAGLLLILLQENIIDYGHFFQNLTDYAQEGWISPKVLQNMLEEGKKYE
ncbi:MAG TPA: hypothetical protein VKK79_14775 [Candidatus Lokiarchaeia archaeon]|nr:hypothetical protein [Candidatus Lokiarchaeia archaeon]